MLDIEFKFKWYWFIHKDILGGKRLYTCPEKVQLVQFKANLCSKEKVELNTKCRSSLFDMVYGENIIRWETKEGIVAVEVDGNGIVLLKEENCIGCFL